ncbi:MAG: hypothetical protein U1F76_11260 [Candidatus Competibacteraceae bacterium]
MRPVNKTKPSQQLLESILKTNKSRGWSENRSLQGALADTIGHYCSFCELPINVGEHVEDKRSSRAGKAARFKDWEHLLLSCNYCQIYRRNGKINESDYLWPDIDSTFTLDNTSPLIYTYKDVNFVLSSSSCQSSETGKTKLVIVEANSGSQSYQKAKKFIDLFQLNTPDYNPTTNTLSFTDQTLATYPDRRLFLRTEAWELAQDSIKTIVEARNFQISTLPYDIALVTARAVARTYGFWSVWMTAFWQVFPDANLIDKLFISTDTRKGIVIHGYQGLDQPTPPEPGPSRPKRQKSTKTYLLFTGTAKDRITYS